MTLHAEKDTPYEGKEFVNWPRYTLLRGKVAWANGEIRGQVGDGRYLRRGPSQLGRDLPSLRKDPRTVATWLYE